MARTGSGQQRRRRDERGAAVVEAALVVPLLLMVVFGITEMDLMLRDDLAAASAVAAGSRVASAAPGAGPGTCETGPTAPPCTPSSSPALAQAAADAVQKAASALPTGSVDRLMVYKANSSGYPGADTVTTMPTSCSGITSCVMFTWRADLGKFRYASGTWDSKTINACVNETDSVGIYLHITRQLASGVFGTSVPLAQRSVMKFEPLPDETCKPGRQAAHA